MLIGHEKHKERFNQFIINDKVFHSYIFSGINGIGKFLFSKILVKSLLCQESDAFENCGCKSCAMIDRSTHPDLLILDEQIDSKLKVIKTDYAIENVRSVVTNSYMSPLVSKSKAVIINNAWNLRTNAFNTLLKVIEEPPENTYFIFITDKYHSILDTIKSRSINIEFEPLKTDNVKKILRLQNKDEDFINKYIALENSSLALLNIQNIDELYGIYNSISDGDFTRLLEALVNSNDKEYIKLILIVLYKSLTEKLKFNNNEKKLLFLTYITTILSQIDYNINLEMVKYDCVSKIREVLEESS